MMAPTRSLSVMFKVYRGQDQPNHVQLLPALSRGGGKVYHQTSKGTDTSWTGLTAHSDQLSLQ